MAQAQVKAQTERMERILTKLKKEYPEAKCSLKYSSPYQLLVATILSAQCTDERVNKVTPGLFERFPTARDMMNADLGEIEKLVQSTGFFRSKARSILESSRDIVEKHGGEVPRQLEELVKLRGVGRKTANVVLGVAFGVPGLVVDTHVKRLTRRMGFTKSQDPVKIEQEMIKVVPKQDWTLFAHLMIDHGRKICTARKAYCDQCCVLRDCPQVGVQKKKNVGP